MLEIAAEVTEDAININKLSIVTWPSRIYSVKHAINDARNPTTIA
jgi:hypothetical protein